jgi:DNA-binding response OmpR family regulator
LIVIFPITFAPKISTGILNATVTNQLIILIKIPGRDGIEILTYIRANGIKSPVIFVTAKDAVTSRVEGLDAGADDYLIKPFSTEELLARIRALGKNLELINSYQYRHYWDYSYSFCFSHFIKLNKFCF